MHELTICFNLVKILEKEALHEKKCVKRLWLEIGDLAGIELDALRFSFPIAALHSVAEKATLEIISVPGQAWCEGCQQTIDIKTYFSACPVCACYNYRIIQGKELRLLKMELA